MTMKTLIPRRFFAFLCGLELFATLLLPPQARALTTVEGTNGTHGTSTAAELDADTDQLVCSEAARGARVTLPSGSVWNVNSCQTATLASTDICQVTPAANSCPASGTNGKIDVGWLPTSVSTNTATGTMVLTGGTLTKVTGTGTATGTATVTAVASTDTWTYTPTSQAVGSFSAIGGVWTKVTGTGTSTGTATATSVASTDTATLTVTYTYTHTHTVTDVAGAVNTTDSRLSDARHSLDTLQVAPGLAVTSGTSTTTATSGTVSNTLTISAPGYVSTAAQICAEQGNAMKTTVTNTYTDTATASGTVTGSATNTASAAGSTSSYTGTATMTSTVTSTGSASATVTATTSATQTATVSFTTTQTWTMTGTGTGGEFGSATFTKTGTVTASSTATASQSTTYTATVTATYTRTSTGVGTRTWTMTATKTLTANLTATGTVTNTWSVTGTGTVTGTSTGTATGTTACVSVAATPTVVGIPTPTPAEPVNVFVPLYLPQQISGGNPVGLCLGPNDTNVAGIPDWATNGLQNAKTISPYLVPKDGTLNSFYIGMAGAAISQGGPVSNPYIRIDIYQINWNTTTLLETLNIPLNAAQTGINNTTTSGNMMQTSLKNIGLALTAGTFIGVVFVPQGGDNSKINAILNLFGQMAISY